MIFIGIHGRRVPTWLQVITPNPARADAVVGSIKWKGIAIVWSKGGAYQVRNLFCEVSMVVRGCAHVTVEGQSPPGGSGGVAFHCHPLITGWHVAAALAGYLLSSLGIPL